MSGPRLAVEKEGTDLRSKAAVERSDDIVWRRGPISDRLGPPDDNAGTSRQSSSRHFHDWSRLFQHDREGKATIAVNQLIIAGARYVNTGGQQEDVEAGNCHPRRLPG